MLTLFEHDTVLFAWTDRDLLSLERLNRSLGVEVLHPTLGWGGRHELQAAQHVGVVRLGSQTIQILPKIYRSNALGDREQQATRNLLSLLAYAGQLTIREHDLAPLLRRNADWLELLTRLFAVHLREEWQRGIIRGYQTCEDELPTLRGKWRITDQLRRPERRHQFAVAYDEFTPDNPLNRVLRFVVERLWTMTRDAENRQMLGLLRTWMEDVTLLPIVSAADASPTRLTRLHQSYAPLLTLAGLFLDGGALQLEAGDQTTFAFLFDMNQLFEQFLVGFLRRHREQILPTHLQSCELLPQSQGATFHLAQTGGKPVFRLKPDIALRNGEKFPLLIDAKYKRLNPNDRRLGVSQDDFYQMYAYARRYDCPYVLLLYPQTAEMTIPLETRFLLDSDCSIHISTVDIQVDFMQTQDVNQVVSHLHTIIEG